MDTTQPRIENLAASVEGGQIHVRFRAEDGFSSIKRAEYSVDAGEWKYIEPVGQISDAKARTTTFAWRPTTRRFVPGTCRGREGLRQIRQYGTAKTVIH